MTHLYDMHALYCHGMLSATSCLAVSQSLAGWLAVPAFSMCLHTWWEALCVYDGQDDGC